MLTSFKTISNPLYALAVLLLVATFSAVIGSVIPFFRRELKVEANTRLTPLDGLRGILCFAVMCHHSLVTFNYIDSNLWELPSSHFYILLGQSSVAMFFCITAFLFWSKAMGGGVNDTWPFFRGRIFRIVPLYVFSALATIAVIARYINWRSIQTIPDIMGLFLMGLRKWSTVGGIATTPVNGGVTWSLQYEWAFYLILPLLALTIRENAARNLALLFVAIGIMFGFDPVESFFPGILAVYAAQSPQLAAWCKTKQATLLIIVVAILFVCVGSNGYGGKGLAATTLVFVPIACGNTVFGLLTLKGLRLMGLVSYSVYLLHAIVLFLGRPLLVYSKHAGAWQYWGSCAGLACVVLVVSTLTFRWIEWPFIQIEKQLRRKTWVNDAHTTAGQSNSARNGS